VSDNVSIAHDKVVTAHHSFHHIDREELFIVLAKPADSSRLSQFRAFQAEFRTYSVPSYSRMCDP
jgi:hypothetical protein